MASSNRRRKHREREAPDLEHGDGVARGLQPLEEAPLVARPRRPLADHCRWQLHGVADQVRLPRGAGGAAVRHQAGRL